MPTVIRERHRRAYEDNVLAELSTVLPYKLFDELCRLEFLPEEIRIRRARGAYITYRGKNIPLRYMAGEEEMKALVTSLCGGSLYAHRETIAEGYISLPHGIRVGVIGRAVTEGGRVMGVYDISSLNIRIPTEAPPIGERLYKLFISEPSCGILIYSSPGVGKTTLLRGFARAVSSGEGARRVCIVDTRDEIAQGLFSAELSVDILSAYPKSKGMEIAARTMNAELIICDEIGDIEEIRTIIGVQNCGVPLVASAHGDSLSSLLRRSGIKMLHDARVFKYYVGIRRKGECCDYEYDIANWETANEVV